MRIVFAVLAMSVTCVPSICTASKSDPIQRLDWLIGEWDFEDAQINGEYRETGTRICEYTLNQTYIVCHSEGTSNRGKKRSYRFYFNFNRVNERFEMVALTAFWPHKDLYILDVSDDNHVIELRTHEWRKSEVRQRGAATIRYNGNDQYVWNIRSNEKADSEKRTAVTFRDTVTRRP